MAAANTENYPSSGTRRDSENQLERDFRESDRALRETRNVSQTPYTLTIVAYLDNNTINLLLALCQVFPTRRFAKIVRERCTKSESDIPMAIWRRVRCRPLRKTSFIRRVTTLLRNYGRKYALPRFEYDINVAENSGYSR